MQQIHLIIISFFLSALCFILMIFIYKKEHKHSFIPQTLALYFLMNGLSNLFFGIRLIATGEFNDLRFSIITAISFSFSMASYVFSAGFSFMVYNSGIYVIRSKFYIFIGLFLIFLTTILVSVVVLYPMELNTYIALHISITIIILILGIICIIYLTLVYIEAEKPLKKKLRLLIIGLFFDRLVSLVIFSFAVNLLLMEIIWMGLFWVLFSRLIGIILIFQAFMSIKSPNKTSQNEQQTDSGKMKKKEKLVKEFKQ